MVYIKKETTDTETQVQEVLNACQIIADTSGRTQEEAFNIVRFQLMNEILRRSLDEYFIPMEILDGKMVKPYQANKKPEKLWQWSFEGTDTNVLHACLRKAWPEAATLLRYLVHGLKEKAKMNDKVRVKETVKEGKPSVTAHKVRLTKATVREDKRGDQVIKKPTPWRLPGVITKKQLNQMREGFWLQAPQSGGRPEIWEVLRAAVEARLSEAQGIIEGAGILVHRADLSVCYDDRGFRYELPKFVLSDPINLI